MTDFSQLVQERHSVRTYEAGVALDDRELRAIFTDVIESPSSFNIQHWQFVVVRDEARKSELRGLSFGQSQVEDCSAVVLVCGRLNAFEDANRIYADSSDEQREKYVPMIEGVYHGNPALQKDEAIRSGSMAAMTLMLAAKNRGWDSGPMIGFDAAQVGEYLNLENTTLPVMMIVIGKAKDGLQPERGYRRPLEEVVRLESADGDALS
ncbi:MAG: nitroreductase family protein [Pseudomonadota bacterium]